MEQQHPAQPVHALIEVPLIGDALYQVKVGEVPHAPQPRCGAEQMQREKRGRGKNAADGAHQRGGHAAGLRQKNGDHGENIDRQIQRPDGKGNVIAPVQGLTDMVPVMDQHGDDHDNATDEHGMGRLFIQLFIQHGSGLLIGHSDSSQLNFSDGQD